MHKRIFLFIFSAGSLSGSAPLPTSPLSTGISVPMTTIDTAGSFHVQGRVHGFSSSVAHAFSVGGYGFVVGNGAYGFDVADTVTPTVGNCTPSLGGITDVTVDITRDLSKSSSYPLGFVRGQVFNTITGAVVSSCLYTITAVAPAGGIRNAGISVGNSGASGAIDFIRWYPGASPVTAVPPAFVSTPAPWLDYEFASSNTYKDSSSGNYRQDLPKQGLTYLASPGGYAPVCNPGTIQTVSTGTPMYLTAVNSYSLNGNATLSYAWSYAGAGADGVVQTPSYSSTNTVGTVASGLDKFGSFNTQLIVTDSDGKSTTCVAHNGVVKTTNTAGAIDLAGEGVNATQEFIIGPQVAWGRNPWPYADTAILNELNLQLRQQSSTGVYQPYWRKVANGSVTLTAGSSTVIGSGTSFKSLFCSGGSSPDGSMMMWHYTGTDGFTHYNQFQVSSCVDDTHVVIAIPGNGSAFSYPVSPMAPWPACPAPAGCSGLAYGRIDTSSVTYSSWLYNNKPANYYDVVEFFLVNYWRSGSDLFYTGAQQLATYWMEWPQLDYYSNCNPPTNNFAPGNTVLCYGESRMISLTGMILWQQMYGGANQRLISALEKIGDWYNYYVDRLLPAASPSGILERDNAYDISGLALMALIETGPKKATYQATIKGLLASTLTPTLRTGTLNGWNIFMASNSSIPGFGGRGYVQVTHGSTTIQGVGTAFNNGMETHPIWTFPSPVNTVPAYCGTCPTSGNVVGGDGKSYIVTAVDAAAQTATIYPAYEGDTCTGTCQRGFVTEQTSGIPGWGVQPFMAGLFAHALFHCAQAMAGYNTDAQQLFLKYAHTAVGEFISTITPDQGGVYNGAYYPGCVPPMLKTSTGTQLYCYGGINSYSGKAWDSSQTYAAGVFVLYANQQYQSAQNSNRNHIPGLAGGGTWWNLVPMVVSPSANRQLAAEGMRALTYDQQYFGTNTAVASALMSQLFSKPGTRPDADGSYLDGYDITIQPPGYYVASLVPGATSFDPTNAKWAGQLCGFSEAAITWPGMFASMPPQPSVGKTAQVQGTVQLKGRSSQ